ncbi:hypothetical protein ACT4S2_09190 [Kocuria turfanensis]|uniref:hypothetical protein n=1 Tax=Kocuria turfanensis TaxID=388357 RepID=UPI0040366222
MTYMYFASTVLALIVAIAFWLTGSDVDLVLLALGGVAVTGALIIVADRLTRKYKDD